MDNPDYGVFKKLIVSQTSSATHPGRVPANFLHYARHYPRGPVGWLAYPLICGWLAWSMPNHLLFIPTVAGCFIFYIYYRRIQAFAYCGDVCPGKVISIKPLRIAVYTDTGQADSISPAIKIIAPPLRGSGLRVGDYVPTIAHYYFRGGDLSCWGDFDPRPAACFTRDPAQVERLLREIPRASWDHLEAALQAESVALDQVGVCQFLSQDAP